MNLFDIGSPNIIESRYFKSAYTAKEKKDRIVSSYELDFNLSGNRVMTLNGIDYKIKENSIVFRRPGDSVRSSGIYDMYILTFNFESTGISGYNRNTYPQPSPTVADIELLKALPAYLEPRHAEDYTEIYRRLISNFGREEREGLCSKLAAKLIYRFAADSISLNFGVNSKNDKIDDTIAFICEHYVEPITLDMIAERVYLDKSYLTRCFKKTVGKTPIEFLIEKRITGAKKLLKDTDMSIEQIASLCGFSTSSYFIMRFKHKLGITPKEYRNSKNDLRI